MQNQKRLSRRVRVFLILLVVAGPAVADDDGARRQLVKTIAASKSPHAQTAFLRGMLKGLEGQRAAEAPEGWEQLSEEMLSSEIKETRDLTMQLSQIFGDRAATARALAILHDERAEVASRRTALYSLLNQRNQEASLGLESLLENNGLRLDAIRGFAVLENPVAAEVLLSRMEVFSESEKRAAVETLASRRSYAKALMSAIKSGEIQKSLLPAHVVRGLFELLGEEFVAVYGAVRVIGEDRQQQIEKYKQLLSDERLAAADVMRGRAVFAKTCAACHKLYNAGGLVGPDLTGSNRANLDYILLNSIDPSYDVPEAYRTTQVMTVDGRVINGVLAEEDSARIVLKTPEQPRVVVAKTDIEVRRVSDNSMMPEGQLQQLKQQEVVDLIKYLQTTEQVELRQ